MAITHGTLWCKSAKKANCLHAMNSWLCASGGLDSPPTASAARRDAVSITTRMIPEHRCLIRRSDIRHTRSLYIGIKLICTFTQVRLISFPSVPLTQVEHQHHVVYHPLRHLHSLGSATLTYVTKWSQCLLDRNDVGNWIALELNEQHRTNTKTSYEWLCCA